MQMFNRQYFVVVLLVGTTAASAEETTTNSTHEMHQHHGESARQETPGAPTVPSFAPALPEGMTLDDVFEYAESPPPGSYPDAIPDDYVYALTLFEQFEYRIVDDDEPDSLGWEAQGWIGADFNKFWWKSEGEAVFEGNEEGESENDFLYSRLISPFWNVQAGLQYANEWQNDDYNDRWSAAFSLQGLAPYKFELDNSLYISQAGDVTAAIEAEYDLRITQRLVLQPRTEIGIAADDIPERELGAGITNITIDLRLRYEFLRELAPYLGLRYSALIGQTRDLADEDGRDGEKFMVLAGLRFAF